MIDWIGLGWVWELGLKSTDWWDAACGNGWGNRMGELFLWALGLNGEWMVGPVESPALAWDDRVGMGPGKEAWMDGWTGVVDWGYRCIGGQDIEVPGAWVHGWVRTW